MVELRSTKIVTVSEQLLWLLDEEALHRAGKNGVGLDDRSSLQRNHFARRLDFGAGADFMKPFRPKLTDKT
jgi:hypothetical protein